MLIKFYYNMYVLKATYVRSFINGGFSSKKILFSTKILFNSVKKSGLSDHHKNMDYYEVRIKNIYIF